MKILHIAPAHGNFPLGKKGPTVACVNLHKGLLKNGADVVLFAAKNAKTSKKRLDYVFSKELSKVLAYKSANRVEKAQMDMAHYAYAFSKAPRFDVVQSHLLEWSFFFAVFSSTPTVIKLSNNPAHFMQEMMIRMSNPNIHFVTITKNQAKHLNPKIQNVHTIHESIDVDSVSPKYGKRENHYLFVGRLVPYKRPHLAIDACIRAKQRITVIGMPADKFNKYEYKYYEKYVEKKLSHKLVTYIPSVPHKQIFSYYKKAKALIFPTTEREPFGLVMTEALACGTPVITVRNNLTSELLSNDVAVFAKNERELSKRLKDVERIEKKMCRSFAEARYSNTQQAAQYMKLYKKITA